MQKPINGRMHGMMDYATVAATAAAPRALGFPRTAENLAYGLAAGYLGLSLMTDYPLSARRMVPFKGHGATEVLLGMALPFLPRLLGFDDDRRARNFFLGLTALTAVTALMTDWNAPDADLEHGDYEVRLNQSRGGARADTREMATV
ncbi:hypothetical protein [Longimicrobium sp.]|uniref:hypothetical protein n=1 Tax=Longimicrobium sp. TaxID=2029185 RepID=UPI002E2F227D|nr:hypothetical protein [Longimicrobium sp.]HEX6042320.1 hypothetical protein [Longimicrobium sp.]